jgi:hypothetical protein
MQVVLGPVTDVTGGTARPKPAGNEADGLDKLDRMTAPARLPLRHGTFSARLAAAPQPRG